MKAIAVITMFIDHFAMIVLPHVQSAMEPLFFVGQKAYSLYTILRLIGRIAFPLYGFLLAEGYTHTRSKKNYGSSLLIFAVVSEIPWNLAHSGSFLFSKQNVFFTLFLGFLGIHVISTFVEEKKEYVKAGLFLMLLFAVSYLLRADYGYVGFAAILFIYVMRRHKLFRTVIGPALYADPIAVLFGFIFMDLYNGKRGFIKGKVLKYAFYAFYPVHLLALYLITKAVYG